MRRTGISKSFRTVSARVDMMEVINSVEDSIKIYSLDKKRSVTIDFSLDETSVHIKDNIWNRKVRCNVPKNMDVIIDRY